ncbi:MAG: pilin, partial [Pseudohongiella sp.]|nr:pilin [Pseudohongiella sp.]
QQRLVLLTFAGVIVALFVIFQMRNVDSVQEMRTEFRYSELVDMVEPIKDTIEAALLSGSTNEMDFLDSGMSGLPDEVLVSAEAHGISIIDGQIIATWKTDESDLDGVTYILTPKIENGEVEWATTGTCGGKNAC